MLCHRGDVYVWTNGCVVCERMDGLHIYLFFCVFYNRGLHVLAYTFCYWESYSVLVCLEEDFCSFSM